MNAAISRAFLECERIEKSFSRFVSESELSQLNKNTNSWQTVSDEMYLLLSLFVEIFETTNGALDPTVCGVLEGWGYDPEYSLREHAAGETGTVKLRKKNEVCISSPIDFGAIGKGYALDRMLLFLEDFSNVFLDAGGDLYGRGKNEKGEPWKVAFEHPTDISLGIGEVEVDEFFLGASSPSRRKWRDRHHLVNPKKKIPADDMEIVFTQAKKGLLADAFSTALFVMGFEKAKEVMPSLPVEAMIIGKNNEIFRSSGFQGKLYS